MFLNDAIKPNVEKKKFNLSFNSKLVLFLRDSLGEGCVGAYKIKSVLFET